MKIAILGDTHAGVRADSHIYLEYQQKFFENVFFPTLEDRGIDFHIQMGDLMDKRQSANFYTVNRFRNMYFEEIKRRGMRGMTLIGNHDIYWRQNTEVNSWVELFQDRYSDFYEGVVEPKTIELDGAQVDIIPWICNENRDRVMKFISDSKSDYLFGHLELTGFPMLRGVVSDHGDNPHIFSKYKQVFSGHYHTYSERDNIMFTGTPYELTWADCGDTKYFFIFDTVTGSVEKIENPYRLFHKIIYNDDEMNYDKFDLSSYLHSYIRVIVQSRDNEKMFDRFMKRVHDEAEPVDVQVTDITVAYREVDIDSVETQDPLQVMVKAVDDNTGLDEKMKTLIRREVLTLHTEALSEEVTS